MDTEESTKLDKFLEGLFEERPIWAKYALQVKCDKAGIGGNSHQLNKTLRSIADYQKYGDVGRSPFMLQIVRGVYTMCVLVFIRRGGPWSGAWVKHGFKPRVRVQSAMHQVFLFDFFLWFFYLFCF